MAWASGDTVTSAKLNHRSNAGPVFNVKDPAYAATADGSTDDTTAVQAAIDAASSATGIVWFPQGTYRVSNLSLKDSVHLRGEGWALTTLKVPDSTNADVIVSSGFENDTAGVGDGIANFSVRDMTLNGNKDSGGSGYGLRFVGRSYNVENVKFKDCNAVGFWSEFSQNISDTVNRPNGWVTNCIADSCGSHGFRIGGRDTVVSGCFATLNTGTGFMTLGSNVAGDTPNCRFSDCLTFFQGTAGGSDGGDLHGFEINQRAYLNNCHAISGTTNTGDGFRLNGPDVIATGCFVDAPGGSGFHLLGSASLCQVVGGHCNDALTAQIEIESAARNCSADVMGSVNTTQAPAGVSILFNGADSGFHDLRVVSGIPKITGTPNATTSITLVPQSQLSTAVGLQRLARRTRIQPHGVTLTWGASVDVDAADGSPQYLTATSDITATLGAPLNAPTSAFGDSQNLRFIVRNASGDTMTNGVAFNSIYKNNGPLSSLGSNHIITMDFAYHAPTSVWVEASRVSVVNS